ncbi:unnamed protein product [Spirodela intermedia]|uniref:Uncharacterized protein n=1 Tax=Spirodela intermedia TaxID=51605 RepID=A0A7I8J8K0_SPIIN|nr:unnamed protein product [Spirodela intermedia]CAA6666556.1 unnamed protein product [Spirodela intermedia]
MLLRLVVRGLQRGLVVLAAGSSSLSSSSSSPRRRSAAGEEELVKKGHFVVVAARGDEPGRRFVVSLRCLSHPRFLDLLTMAEEEFGFCQEGALAIPSSRVSSRGY